MRYWTHLVCGSLVVRVAFSLLAKLSVLGPGREVATANHGKPSVARWAVYVEAKIYSFSFGT